MSGIPDWQMNGFGAPPKAYIASGVEKVFRCYSASFQDAAGNWHGSRRSGNCFWVFRFGSDDGPIAHAGAVTEREVEIGFLERNLNAALWGNTYQTVGLFRLHVGVSYLIGPIGQETRGIQKDARFRHARIPEESVTHLSSRDFTGGPKRLLQVVLPEPWSRNPTQAMTLIAEFPVKGRERYLGGRSTTWS